MRTNDDTKVPYIVEDEGRLVEANDAFFELIGFDKSDILGKPFLAVWKDLLRIDPGPDSVEAEAEAYLFTEQLEARYVKIIADRCDTLDGIRYMISEIPGSRFSEKNQFVEKLISENMTGIGIYTADDFMLLEANQVYLNYLPAPNNTKELTYGNRLAEIIPGFEGSDTEKIWKDLLYTNKSVYIKETQSLLLDNRNKYWDNTVTPISEDGTVKYIVSMLDDVTERVMSREHMRRQKDIIKQQNKQLEAIFNSISDSIFIFSKDGKLVMMNEEAKKLVYPFGSWKAIGDSYATTKYFYQDGSEIPIGETPTFRALKGETIRGEKVLIRQPHREGVLEFHASPIYDEHGDIDMVISVTHDITESVEKEKTIQRQKEQLEAILDNLQESIRVFDKTGKFFITNKIAKKHPINSDEYYLATLDSIKGVDGLIPFYDKDGNIIPNEELPAFRISRGEIVNEKLVKYMLDDREYYNIISGVPIYDEQGNFLYGIISSHNITEFMKSQQALKDTQEQLLRAELDKNEALQAAIKLKDEFLYLITHEFRTPMSVVNSALQAIELIYKDEVTANVGRFLNTIKQNTNRQLRLVNNLLDITRINSGNIRIKRSNIDIVFVTKAIVDSVEVYARQKGVNLSFESSIPSKEIFMDEEKYERILLNLMANALKFTPRGKSINISVSLMKKKSKRIIYVSVRDEGIGIPKEKQQVIFERFGQADTSLSRQAEGTGLGLHLVKLLVNALDAQITLESEEGRGSKFTVALPVVEETDVYEEIAACREDRNINGNNDSRIVQSASIEFSDIYFD